MYVLCHARPYRHNPATTKAGTEMILTVLMRRRKQEIDMTRFAEHPHASKTIVKEQLQKQAVKC